MAIDILSIPSMSAEVEQVFSSARRTILWEQMRLGSERIENNECLKSFIRIRMKQDDEYIEELRKLTSRITRVVPSDVEMVEDEMVEIEESIK